MSRTRNNLTAKIFALIIAIFLWSYVMSEVNPEIPKEIRNVDVTLKNTDLLKRQGLVVMEPKDFKVNVRIAGKKSDIDRFLSKGSGNILAQADLAGYGEGQHRVPVTISLLDNSSNIRVISWEPREILFTFDKIITKEKTVSIKTEGEVGENYVVDSITAKPQTILIKGPRTWVNQVAEARVLVNMKDRTSSTSLTLPVQLLDDQENDVSDLEKDPGTVDIDIKILRKKTLPIRLQIEGDIPDNYNIEDIKVYPSTITVKGDNSIEGLTHINTKPIKIQDLLDGSFDGIELDLPENVQLLDPQQKITLNYSVEEIIEKEYEIDFDNVEIRNLEEGLSLEDESPGSISVKLKGPKSSLEKILEDNLKLYVDLKALKEGKHEVDVKIEGITDITVEYIMPDKIEIDLIKEEE